jgi:hypothetical protein
VPGKARKIGQEATFVRHGARICRGHVLDGPEESPSPRILGKESRTNLGPDHVALRPYFISCLSFYYLYLFFIFISSF